MSKSFVVTKILDFCYGHRLLNYKGKCQHPHGHNGRVEIVIASSALDERGIAYDFSDIKKKVKKFIDENLDHRMILHKDDPLVAWMKKNDEPVMILDVNPTAENLAKIIFEKTAELKFPVEAVRLWETPDSYAVYRKPEERGHVFAIS